MHPNTIADVRANRPDLADIPDDALARLSFVQMYSVRLHAIDAGRVTLRALVRVVITFGDVMTAFDARGRRQWRDFWERHGY